MSKYQKFNNALESFSCEAAYVLNKDLFNEEYFKVLKAFKSKYDKTNIAYSFKTNYIPDLVNEVRKNKGYAEVVSSMELKLAQKMGFKNANIFFNGPFKHKEFTKDFLLNGGTVNVDSLSEFNFIKHFAELEKVKVNIGIRLNFNSEQYTSRFGVDIDSNDIDTILQHSKESKFISIISIHCHYAPRSIDKWEFCTKQMISFLKNKFSKYSDKLSYISLGGGMFSDMSPVLKSQIPFDIPTFEQYANVSSKLINDFFIKEKIFRELPELLIEPGTALASKALDFLVRVVSVKKIKNKFIINTTGSKYNVNPSVNRLDSPFEVFNKSKRSNIKLKNSIVCGYTCIETDILHKDFNADLSEGDLILFKEVGSYSLVMKPQFILPNVPIIEFINNEKLSLIKRGETFEDVFSGYQMLC